MYRLKTKEDRLNSQKSQFNSLLNSGYTQDTYKGLQIFTKEEKGHFFLKIFRDTSSNAICNYYYTKEERRSKAIEDYKSSYDRSQAYKAEAKANTTKSTAANCAATIKEELKKAFPGISFSVKSSNFSMGNSVDVRWDDGPTEAIVNDIIKKYQYGSFNSMEDIYENSNSREDIPQAKYVSADRSMSEETRALLMPHAIEIFNNHDFGCLDAGNLLHRIFHKSSIPTEATITGIKKTDCKCGQVADFYTIDFTLPQAAQKEEQKAEEKPAPVEVPAGTVQIIDYSDKSFAVIGEFSKMYDDLINLGGKYNKFLSCGRGIIFSKTKLNAVIEYLSPKTEEKQEQPEEPTQEETTEPEAEEMPEEQPKETAPAEVQTTLRDEIVKTIDFFVESDLNMYGHITEGTREAARVQNVPIEQKAAFVQRPANNYRQLILI